MDAIMLALVAVLLANADGAAARFVAALSAQRGNSRPLRTAIGASFAANAVIAAGTGALLQRAVGPGVVALFLSICLIGAAAAIVWPKKRERDVAPFATCSAPLVAARLFLSDFGNRTHCLIGAVAASSGAALWAAAGGAVGWVLALLPTLALGLAPQARAARALRWGGAMLLALWGVTSAFSAFGLIES